MTYQVSMQASEKTDFTVDLLWWGSLSLAPNNYIYNYVFDICMATELDLCNLHLIIMPVIICSMILPSSYIEVTSFCNNHVSKQYHQYPSV